MFSTQGADGAIYGKVYAKFPHQEWKPVRKVVSDVMLLTALSAVSTNGKLFSCCILNLNCLSSLADLKKLRLYYQESDSTVREQRLDGGIWFKFPIETPTTTRIATVAWNDHRNSSSGWEGANFRTPALSFTDIGDGKVTVVVFAKADMFRGQRGTEV